MKIALITGITGQDGVYLADFLLKKGYDVYGGFRRLSTPNFWRLKDMEVFDKIKLVPLDLSDQSSMMNFLEKIKPDEIYNLAAQSFVGVSFEQPIHSGDITGLGVTRLIDTIRTLSPKSKFYQASSSEMYGDVGDAVPQDETTVFKPRSPYAAAKTYAHYIVQNYRSAYNLYACSGILFNHESPYRGIEFVTRKITNAVARIKLGLQKELTLGNIDAQRDWGFAGDYVQAMWMMLQQDKPDDYVIATNEAYTVRDFAKKSFEIAGLNYEDYTKTDTKFMRPSDVHLLKGNPQKAKDKMGWEPKVNFNELIKMMVERDIQRWRRYLKGEVFPWDAINAEGWEVTSLPSYRFT
ncbi:GDP-mannose 4,6-dehydratase [Candidatus Woesearchaeota archaeon]|nr:GDP-mannose 4,6-dehydratase [Candidatus Woesearchaeota archaeon]